MANYQQNPLGRQLVRDFYSLPRVAAVVGNTQYDLGVIGKQARSVYDLNCSRRTIAHLRAKRCAASGHWASNGYPQFRTARKENEECKREALHLPQR